VVFPIEMSLFTLTEQLIMCWFLTPERGDFYLIIRLSQHVPEYYLLGQRIGGHRKESKRFKLAFTDQAGCGIQATWKLQMPLVLFGTEGLFRPALF
jgi:hypothetical protein